MMKILINSLFTMSAMALLTPVSAQDENGASGGRRPAGGHGKDAFVGSYDVDKDGRVTQEEFQVQRAEIHKGYDMDGDGIVTQLEYVEDYRFRMDAEMAERRAGNLRQAHVRFGILDADDNANLTLDELNDSGSRTFSRLDTNGDGIIDASDTADSF